MKELFSISILIYSVLCWRFWAQLLPLLKHIWQAFKNSWEHHLAPHVLICTLHHSVRGFHGGQVGYDRDIIIPGRALNVNVDGSLDLAVEARHHARGVCHIGQPSLAVVPGRVKITANEVKKERTGACWCYMGVASCAAKWNKQDKSQRVNSFDTQLNVALKSYHQGATVHHEESQKNDRTTWWIKMFLQKEE